jgi:formamidopyrimidine-DNA glycosylase
MPEIPDLEAIRAFLNARVPGREIVRAETLIPYIVRTGGADFVATVTGNRLGAISRYGKFLLAPLERDEQVLVINPMLTGRFQYCEPGAKKRAKTALVLAFDNGMELRYADRRVMGKIYVVPEGGLDSVPMFAEMGPDALAVGEDEFVERIRKYSGAIKNVLTNHKFVAGIGNAYSDEILFHARIDPFRKRTTLKEDDLRRLHGSLRSVMEWAIPILQEHFRDELDYDEWRAHLKVHRKGARPGADKDEGRCPRCGMHISEISPNDRVTSWCRNCQT